jgi:glyoxylase-like metal-dependent hydrolase (beta-lactamase superfamily II)/rhodanese-related sulfurtransferase
MTSTAAQRAEAVTPTRSPAIEIVETPNLGDRSYVVHLDGFAVVIDPQRDIDRVTEILQRHQLTVTHVLETHIHNDYVSGGLELARSLGAQYVVPAGYSLRYQAEQLSDGDGFTSGPMAWRALHTPGHTPQHLSYVVAIEGIDAAAFTGGSLLYGSVGRPDLIGPDMTEELAHAQWRSVRRLTTEVAGHAGVFPTHGFGSFCSATATSGLASTIAEQAMWNPASLLPEEEFVAELIAGLDAYPAYYAHMAPANEDGPGPIDLTLPDRADPAELRRRIDAGEWIVDLRNRRVFAAGHLRGALSFEGEGNAVTYLAWLIPWGTPITLLATTAEEVTAMQRELVRVGIDRPAAHSTGTPEDWARGPQEISSYRIARFADVAHEHSHGHQLILLDARREQEWAAGHLPEARHIPLHDLPDRLGEVAAWSRTAEHAGADPRVWIYCGSGFRAAVAASLLDRAGIPVVHIDEDFGAAAGAGLQIAFAHQTDRRLGETYTD